MEQEVPATSDTKTEIILTAERLFGEYGINGVSLRRISKESGNRNVYAAQYHFENKENILVNIMQFRRPSIDMQRREFFSRLGIDPKDTSMETILTSILQPLMECKDEKGMRGFVRFQRELLQYDMNNHIWRQVENSALFTAYLYGVLRDNLSFLPDDIIEFRISTVGRLGVYAIAEYDRSPVVPSLSAEDFLANLVSMSTAALLAPLSC